MYRRLLDMKNIIFILTLILISSCCFLTDHGSGGMYRPVTQGKYNQDFVFGDSLKYFDLEIKPIHWNRCGEGYDFTLQQKFSIREDTLDFSKLKVIVKDKFRGKVYTDYFTKEIKEYIISPGEIYKIDFYFPVYDTDKKKWISSFRDGVEVIYKDIRIKNKVLEDIKLEFGI